MLLEYGVCRIPDKCLYVCIDSLLAVYQISNKRHFAIDLMRRALILCCIVHGPDDVIIPGIDR